MKRTQTAEDSIKCPTCGEIIPMTETLKQQLVEQARQELRQELAERQKSLASREREIETKEASVHAAEQELDRRVNERVSAETDRLAKDALAKARTAVSVQLKDFEAAAAENERRLREAENNELQLRKDKRELEEAKKAFELETARTLDSERRRIHDKASAEADERHRLRDAEKDQKLKEALAVNEELRRKLEQGSQQTQGEVLELALEALLHSNCALDEIVPVGKGIRGADVLQRVRTKAGLVCGSILWETKNAKNWNDNWIEKLRSDQQEARADVAVLVTDVFPKDADAFAFRDGVWITSPRYVSGVVAALRHGLVEVAVAKTATASKSEIVEALFAYLTGPDFRHRVEAIVRAFINMKEDLDEEKRVTARRWAKRDKQLDLIIGNTSGMYGDLQGLIGTPMQPIPALEAGGPRAGDGVLVETSEDNTGAREGGDAPF